MQGLIKRGAGVAFGLAALIWLASCQDQTAEKLAAQRPRPAVPVTVAEVKQKDVPLTVEAVGNVEAYAAIVVRPRVGGPIVGVHFREGQDVKAGDPLFSVDPMPYRIALDRAQAQLARDQAQAANTRVQLGRTKLLADRGVVSVQSYDDLKAQTDSLAAAVKADQAAVEDAQQQIGWCNLTAPIAGRTGDIQTQKGTLVKPNDPMVTIAQMQPIYVSFSVPEKYLPGIRRGMSGGRLEVDARPAQEAGAAPVQGLVTFVDNMVNAGTGTIRLKATMGNEDRRLWPGQFVKVVLVLEVEAGAVVVPSEAVQMGQAGQYVFVLGAEAAVELRKVKVSRSSDGESIIGEGLKPGERVVTDGQLNLGPGSKVSIKNNQKSAGGERTAK
jgi:multidrug efflux system membrane fusion protein